MSDVPTIDQHARARKVELAQSIAGRRKVYLDLRYWITVRDAALGVRRDAPAQAVLAALRAGVAEGSCICPIGTSTFLELFKQPYKPDRRVATARLIDELSLGVTIANPEIVIATEIHRWLLKRLGSTSLFDMQDLVWTKVSYALGDVHPLVDGAGPSEQLALQTAFFDFMWDIPLTKMVHIIADAPVEPDRFDALSVETNLNNREFAHELVSYERTYDIELRGAIEVASASAVESLIALKGYVPDAPTPSTKAEWAAAENFARNLLYLAFKKLDGRSAMRTMHIGASLHAGMRWDKPRQFTANDYYDFDHARAALAYCDLFLTEGPLRTLIADRKLQQVNGCTVISDLEEAVAALAS